MRASNLCVNSKQIRHLTFPHHYQEVAVESIRRPQHGGPADGIFIISNRHHQVAAEVSVQILLHRVE
jgi:hypothetical protein